MTITIERQCCVCGKEKPRSEFYRRGAGLVGECKVCRRTRGRNSYQRHKAKKLQYATKYRGAHQKAIKLYKQQYAQRMKVNPEYRYEKLKRDAPVRGRKVTLTKAQFLTLWNQPCFYCGDKTLGMGIDRVDNKGHYTINNVVSCCPPCNYFKGGMSQTEFLGLCKRIAAKHSSV